MPIQLFVPKFEVSECLQEIKQCLENGWTGLGYKTVELESAWNEYTGFPKSHFINSATAGLHLAVKVLKKCYKWNDGDEIISTPLTFVSTNHAIMYENLRVIFADIDKYLCLDPQDIEKKITSKTRAIMYVGIGGNTGQYKQIVELCKRYKLHLIIDAAHMAGTRLYGEILGKEADAVVYSFQAVKNLPTADSGMICFRNNECDELCRKLTWLGIDKTTFERVGKKGAYKWMYDVDHLGYKYHGNSIIAAIGLVQLKYLDRDNAYRRQLAKWYQSRLNQYDSKVHIIPQPEGCESSYHTFIIKVKNRNELLLALNQAEIYPGVHYRDNTNYPMYAYGYGTCPHAHEVSEQILSLPLHLNLTKTDIDYVCDQVIKYSQE
ncbi:DegT/DnrJ/EryC1/StrS family aminotransferase [Bacillus wiedmannii]|uniref:DegT/DnrJ/EryC1/StrS family aminotransferase n=1 Tax=Bacillus wiedmannii TaxID=1890302 RepID=A0A4U2MHF4_9BACI|nr:DegT/DnrJ/EryC1/StrS family aminotransferase [Bacillus wiedmannii]TKH10400.1 DegT/DnrJ/EryC1/StrS family aminotransferase [Bacillus wiedmannii]